MEYRKELLLKFQSLSHKAGFTQIDEYGFDFVFSNQSKTLTLAALIHGNEVCGLDVILKLIDEMIDGHIRPAINIRFLLGNTEAYLQDKRFVETDMNRSFQRENPKSLEEKRAQTLEKLFKNSDCLIDLHQTLQHTKTPFFIFNYTDETFRLARSLNNEIPLITYKSPENSQYSRTITTVATRNGIPAFTIELGEKGHDETQLDFGIKLVKSALSIIKEGKNSEESWENCYTWGQILSNDNGDLHLEGSYSNFDPITKGDLLATGENKKIYAELDGKILFPKYGESRIHMKELGRILKPISSPEEIYQ